MHPLFLHPKPFTATGHLTATLPKSPQILANQAGHLVVSKYIMHFHPILCAWKEPEAGRLVIKNKDYSPASLAVITKRMSLLLSPFLQPKCHPLPVACLNPGPLGRVPSLLLWSMEELTMWILVPWPIFQMS